MLSRRSGLTGLALAVVLTGAPAGIAVGETELTAERAAELVEQLRPAEDAAWRSIPWKTAVLDAQRVAASDGKPIFIWAMDGHPLGCT